MSDVFDWTPDVSVVSPQAEVAVYTNPNGGIVTRACGWPEPDSVIVLNTLRAARDVALALLNLAGEE